MKNAKRLITALLVFGMAMSTVACTAAPKETKPQDSTPPVTGTTTSGTEATQPEVDGELIPDGQMKLDYAQNFKIDLYKGGYRMITGGSEGLSYLVVPEGKKVPADLEQDVKVLQLPITSMYVASASMVGLMDELGALDRVKLVATEEGKWYLPNVKSEMEKGNIAYSGAYSTPDYELMTANGIQLHIDTPMVSGAPEVLEKFTELGIPSLVENSSAENHPMVRVEWVKLLGVLLGMEDEAQKLYAEKKAVADASTAAESTGITAALGYITTSGKGYARNGGDYLSQMIGMAGGEYIQKDMNPDKSGNSNMTFEEWYVLFKDADVLIYWNLGQKFYSIQEMIDFNPLFADFKAVKEGKVFITAPDFSQTSIINILEDMHTIFHSTDPNVTTEHLIRLN